MSLEAVVADALLRCASQEIEVRAKAVADALRSELGNDHIIEIQSDGWIMSHSLDCRAMGELFDCPVHKAANGDLDGTEASGRYLANVNEAGLVLVGL